VTPVSGVTAALAARGCAVEIGGLRDVPPPSVAESITVFRGHWGTHRGTSHSKWPVYAAKSETWPGPVIPTLKRPLRIAFRTGAVAQGPDTPLSC